LTVYKKSYEQARVFFEVSKRFPAEERYALTSQDTEMTTLNHEIGKMLGSMIRNPEKFLLTPNS